MKSEKSQLSNTNSNHKHFLSNEEAKKKEKRGQEAHAQLIPVHYTNEGTADVTKLGFGPETVGLTPWTGASPAKVSSPQKQSKAVQFLQDVKERREKFTRIKNLALITSLDAQRNVLHGAHTVNKELHASKSPHARLLAQDPEPLSLPISAKRAPLPGQQSTGHGTPTESSLVREPAFDENRLTIYKENLRNSFKGFVMPPEAYVQPEANPARTRRRQQPTFGSISPRQQAKEQLQHGLGSRSPLGRDSNMIQSHQESVRDLRQDPSIASIANLPQLPTEAIIAGLHVGSIREQENCRRGQQAKQSGALGEESKLKGANYRVFARKKGQKHSHLRASQNPILQSYERVDSTANFSNQGHVMASEPDNALLKVKYQLSRLQPEQAKIARNAPITGASKATRHEPGQPLYTEPAAQGNLKTHESQPAQPRLEEKNFVKFKVDLTQPVLPQKPKLKYRTGAQSRNTANTPKAPTVRSSTDHSPTPEKADPPGRSDSKEHLVQQPY